MSLFCCRRSASASSVPQIQPPRIVIHRSAPRPQASRQNIEAFYLEGRELLRVQQEEKERATLREALKEEYKKEQPRDDRFDKDAKEPSDRDVGIGAGLGYSAGSKVSLLSEFGSINTSKTSIPGYEKDDMPSSSAKKWPTGQYLSPQSAEMAFISSGLGLSSPTPRGGSTPNSLKSSGEDNSTAMPATPAIRPYQMPSIATTIATIGDAPGGGVTGGKRASSRSLRNTPDQDTGMQSPPEVEEGQLESVKITTEPDNATTPESKPLQRNSYGVDGESGSTLSDAGNTLDAPDLTGTVTKTRDWSEDTTTDECFTPNEFFSRIPSWVRPSTSTFMSFASSPEHRINGDPDSPDSDRTLHYPVSRCSSRPFNPPGTAGTTRSFSLLLPPSTPRGRHSYSISRDNTSSCYPSHETSRCQSLIGSTTNFPDFPNALSPSALGAALTHHVQKLPHLPNNSDGQDSPKISGFNLPWDNEDLPGSPRSNFYKNDLTRSSSLVHLQQIEQQRNCGFQRGFQTPPRQRSLPPSPLNPRRNVGLENLLQRRTSSNQAVTGKLDYVCRGGKEYGVIGSAAEDQGVHIYKTNTETAITSAGRYGILVGTASGGNNASNSMNGRLRSSWSSNFLRAGTPGRNVLRRNVDTKALRNSISLGERIWERYNTRDKIQERSQIDTAWESQAEEVDRRTSNQSKRTGMIKSRSMTLRNSFTHSMVRLKNKVSHSSGFRSTSMFLPPPQRDVGEISAEALVQSDEKNGLEYHGAGLIEKIEVAEEAEMGISSIEFHPTLPREMCTGMIANESRHINSTGEDSTSILIQNDGLASTVARGSTALPISAASSGPGSRRWSTIYDDCVAFPFADTKDQSDDESDQARTDSVIGTPKSVTDEGYHDALERTRGRDIWTEAKEGWGEEETVRARV